MEINWRKMGLIFRPSGEGFFKSHATRTVPYLRRDGTLRIFFGSRCAENMPHPSYIDVDAANPQKVLAVNTAPMLALGRTGTFDDSGFTPISILRHNNEVRLYYSGWKRRRYGVSIESSLGLAYLQDDGSKVIRAYEGPIVGQDIHHPLLTASPFVLHDDGRYKMWYCSGTDWRMAGDNPEPIYTVYYAESEDGIRWRPFQGPAIPYAYDGELISTPWVIKIGTRYHMWYSKRGYATKAEKNYTIGYAESDDGIAWTRMDECAGISRSADGWDSEMVCYPSFFRHEDRVFMFYSGNDVGRGGIGYAVADNFLE